MHTILKGFITVSLLLVCFVSMAQRPIKERAVWSIDGVSVYESGARIQRSEAVKLNALGEAHILLGGLAVNLDEKSIQVALPMGWALSSRSAQVGSDSVHVAECEKMTEDLTSNIKSAQQTISLRRALLAAYEEERAMVQANRKVGGVESLLVEDLRELADFWRDRVKELEYLMLELRLEIEALELEVVDLESGVREWQKKKTLQEGQITMRLIGEPSAMGRVEISYIALDAYWETAYDAQVSDDGNVNLKRYARVVQHTGSVWTGVSLRFLAGNPTQSLAPPSLDPVFLSVRQGGSTGYEWASSVASAQLFKDVNRTDDNGMGARNSSNGPAIDRYTFEPMHPVRIAGDGSPERIALEEMKLDGELTYLVLPAFSDESYQLAASADWNQARLMAGSVQVVAGGAYRGAFQLSLPAPGDTLEFPLGQDPSVRSHRKRMMDLCSTSAFGGTKRNNQAFQIDVVNHHNRSINVRVMDRIPMSNSTEIKVFPQELSGGELDETTGVISWETTLAPNEQKSWVFSYKVEYPKRSTLQGL